MKIINIIHIAQIVVAALLILVILLQNKGAGLSDIFGGAGGIYQTKRGLEKKLFIATIIFAIIFFIISFASVIMM